ncbi:MAG TPA: triose-phosphate isomerase [Nitrospirales bacterium]|nr:triose-phosphate isomerase [Nitrospirales bacterium]
MAARPPLIAGNWKMHKTASEGVAVVRELLALAADPSPVEAVLAPPFTALAAVSQAIAGSPYALAAQNMHWEDHGAFTGEISAPMLTDLGCRYVIIGHSERRRLFGEDDRMINNKVRAALRHDLRPILCVGETLAERDCGSMNAVITRQLTNGLAGIEPTALGHLTIAYEPVWAIGTGQAATPAQATDAHRTLRQLLMDTWADAGRAVRILYGGSVTAENAAGFLGAAEVSGALVGGACLDPKSFAKILRFAKDSLASHQGA